MGFHVFAAGEHQAVSGLQQAGFDQQRNAAARGIARGLAAAVVIHREHVAHQGHLAASAVMARKRIDRHRRAEPRQVAGGATGFGHRHHCAHTDVFRQKHGGHRDGLVGAFQAALGLLEIGVGFELLFCTDANARHRLDRLHRPAAGGALLRQHHRVGAVDHRVGHVQHFGAGRDRAVDHRLQHLGGRDHHFFARDRHPDDLLLQARQFGVADLHAKVATRHHHHVAGIHDLGEVVDRLAAFDLRDQSGIAARRARHATRFVHVLSVAAERHRDEIHAHPCRDFDQFAIMFGQRAQRQAAALLVQPLAVGQRAVVEDCGDNAFALHPLDLQLHDAVVQQQHVASRNIARQAEITDAYLGRIAGRRIGAGDQVEARAHAQLHLAGGEALDADLRARQVGEDTDLAANLERHGPHRLAAGDLRGRVAMREIQPHHVHAGAQHRFQHLRRIGGRAKRCNDAGTAAVIGHQGSPVDPTLAQRIESKRPHSR